MRKTFETRGWRPRICKNFEIPRTICFFNLFLEVSQIWHIRTVRIQVGIQIGKKQLGFRNLQEQVKKAFCYQKFLGPFTVWINCSSDLKMFANSRPSASNFKSFSRSLGQFFLTVGQNNFGNKIPWVMLNTFLIARLCGLSY